MCQYFPILQSFLYLYFMKFLALLALPTAMYCLNVFKSHDQINKCIDDCEEFVTPCVMDQICQKPYSECINSDDPFTCLSSVNSIRINKIAQCFDSVCEELPELPEFPQQQEQNQIPVNDEEDLAEMAQFQEASYEAYAQVEGQTADSSNQIPVPGFNQQNQGDSGDNDGESDIENGNENELA